LRKKLFCVKKVTKLGDMTIHERVLELFLAFLYRLLEMGLSPPAFNSLFFLLLFITVSGWLFFLLYLSLVLVVSVKRCPVALVEIVLLSLGEGCWLLLFPGDIASSTYFYDKLGFRRNLSFFLRRPNEPRVG
jgi:hypothetical protein